MADTAKILTALGARVAKAGSDTESSRLNERPKAAVAEPKKVLEMDKLVLACLPEGVPVFSAGLPEA